MALSLRTPLCADLGIVRPILNAAIGSGAGPELVAAVSNAGGSGVLGARGMSLDDIRLTIARTRELTDRPFGVNFIIDEVGWAGTDEERRHRPRPLRSNCRTRSPRPRTGRSSRVSRSSWPNRPGPLLMGRQ